MAKNAKHHLLSLVVLAALSPCPGLAEPAGQDGRPAEVTAETYDRAARLLNMNLRGAVLNASIKPQWIGQSDEFWYRRETATGHEFVRVDAANGRKRPAFDHGAIARAIGSAPADGERLPFETFEYVDAGASIRFQVGEVQFRCALRSVRCTQQPARTNAPNISASPDGKWGVFTRENNLWLVELSTGRERRLTNDGAAGYGFGVYPDGWMGAGIWRAKNPGRYPPFKVVWAPDSSRFIVPRIDERHVAAYPIMESVRKDSFRPAVHMIRLPLVGEKPPTHEYFIFDAMDGAFRPIALPPGMLATHADQLSVSNWWWSGDNRHAYAVASGENMESAYLFDIDLATGAARTVIEEQLQPRVDLNASYYDAPNVQVIGDMDEVIWFSQRDGWGHLYLYDGRTGRLKNRITSGDWLVRDIAHVDPVRRLVYFSAGGREPGNPYHRYLYSAPFDGGQIKPLTPQKSDHEIDNMAAAALDFLVREAPARIVSPSGRYLVYSHSTVSRPPETTIRSAIDGRLVAVIETADASKVYAAGWRPPEEFTVKAADGETDLYGVLYRPSNFDASRSYPVIDMQYAAPPVATAPRNFMAAVSLRLGGLSQAAYAELGFLVMTIDARGTAHRSKRFHDVAIGRLHVMGLDDHAVAIRQLGQRHEYVDLERVGIWGGSYGGWTVLRAMLGFPEFFKVGVSLVPPGAFHNMYQDRDWTALHGLPQYNDGSQWHGGTKQVPRNWTDIDNMAQASRLDGKLLLLIAEMDERAPAGSALQFVDALIEARKPFDMLYFPSRHHYYLGGEAQLYAIGRTWDYFVEHLLGAAPPRGYAIKTTQSRRPPALSN